MSEATSTTTATSGGDTTSAAPAAPATVDVDAASLAAAREAMGAPAPETAAPAGEAEEAGVAAPGEPAKAEPAAAAAEQTAYERVMRDIKARDDEQKAREKLREQVRAEARAELEAERTKIREEETARVRAELKDSFKRAPVKAITDLEVDGGRLITDLAERAGNPLYDRLAELEAQLTDVRTKGSSAAEERIKALESAIAKREQADMQAARAAEDRQVASVFAEKAPSALAYFGGDAAVVKRAREVATSYCEATRETHCPYDVIVQQLTQEAKTGVADELRKLDARREALSKLLQQPAGDTGKPTETNGRTGPRTLSAQGASERRASPKSPAEMTPAERDEAMLAAAREHMGPKKKSRSL